MKKCCHLLWLLLLVACSAGEQTNEQEGLNVSCQYPQYWDVNPFNPVNNINYTTERTKLPVVVLTHPTLCDNPFFWSVPVHDNNMPVLGYQQAFVDKLLSHTLAYDHLLYCIDNETSVTSEWGRFWSEYIRKKAAETGKQVHLTEMWDPWDLNHLSHRESFDHPETYSFVEISQNNHQHGENQWNNGLYQIERLRKAGNLRPVNNVKTYGAYGGRPGKEYLVYFPQQGEVELELSEGTKKLSVQRLEILTGTWKDEEIPVSENRLRLTSPGRHYIFLVLNH